MSQHSPTDLMKFAIEEHLKCAEFPRVGAVVAKNGIVLSTGYRGERKRVHAERVAIEKLCAQDLRDATIYTTLEPCVALQESGIVDLLSENGAIRVAAGATSFSDITDPMVFRFPSHYARLSKGMIAIVKPNNATFCVLVKLLELYENDILFQWEIRND